eukprot:GFUD01014272.1.p1 GENE.GFUD01014272.1~~GFUD01014272.1.p1  ORF type:complete len:625 (-),score=206.86 GFUD01014272.1:148-2022(-)
MAFSFGSTAQPASGGFGGFGATTAQPSTGFGAAAPQPSTGFGGFGAASQPATGFGAAAAPSGGGGFVGTSGGGGFVGFGATTSQPSTGFGGFGTTTATAQPATGFGGFGGATTTATAQPATGFGGFGATTAQPSTGFGGFGATTSQPSTGFGGFGATAAQPSTGFGGFGAASQPSTGFGGFGAATTQAGTGFGGFGAAAANKPTGFGTAFGAGSTAGFGASNPAAGFGVPQPANPAQPNPAADPVESLYHAVLHCNLYNDERDSIIARWNMLQASWGQGKAYYSNQAQPVVLTPDNPFCRFKAVAYSAMPKHDNKDGLVSLMFKKKLSEVEAGKSQISSSIAQLLGNKPTLTVTVEAVKAAGDTTEVVVTVTENNNGQIRKVPAQDLHTFLNTQATQLKSMGVEMVIPKLSFNKSDIAQYLDTPPSGIDARLWKQAIADNPSPTTLLPVPLVGFKSLQTRITAQETQNKAHCGRLDTLAQDIENLNKKQADTVAALTEAKRKQLELAHRVLKVLVKQEITRKAGFTITYEEEQLRGQLEGLAGELATPTQFKGRLNELLSQVRLQSQATVLSGGEKYTLDQYAVQDIKSVLKDQQNGIQALVQCVKEDLKDLEVIMTELGTENK